MPREPELSNPGSVFALWYGLLAGPIAFMTQMELQFIMVPWTCSIGSQWWLHLITIIALLFPISAGVISWRMWLAAGMGIEDEQGGQVGRTRAMSLAGVLMSGMFAVAMIAQAVPSMILGACQ